MIAFLLFLQIPKIAGTTIHQILKRQYGTKYQHGQIEVEPDYLPSESTYQDVVWRSYCTELERGNLVFCQVIARIFGRLLHIPIV